MLCQDTNAYLCPDEAGLTHSPFKDLLVSTSRRSREGHAFCSAVVHTAILSTRHVDNETWTVLERSDECQYLADAVENL